MTTEAAPSNTAQETPKADSTQQTQQGHPEKDLATALYEKAPEETKEDSKAESAKDSSGAPEDAKAKDTEEKKAQEGDSQSEKPKEGEKPEKQKDEPNDVKYDLKLPETPLIESGRIEEIVSFAKENKLSNDAAQEMLERENSAVIEFHNKQLQEYEKTKQRWLEESAADPEIGGEALKANAARAKLAFDKFGSPAFKELLTKTGYGDHPEIVRVFSRVGKLLEDDKAVRPGAASGSKVSEEELFYPSHTQQQENKQ
jgi:hypothetical protein